MEPVLMILIPGVVGGLVLALLIARKWRKSSSVVVPRRLEAPSPALINMSQIKVEGIGGLGMVAAVVAVAIADSRIGAAMVLALTLGAGLALLLIRARRRSDASRSNAGPDDRSTLHLDDRRPAPPDGVRATIDDVKHAGALGAHFKSFA